MSLGDMYGQFDLLDEYSPVKAPIRWFSIEFIVIAVYTAFITGASGIFGPIVSQWIIIGSLISLMGLSGVPRILRSEYCNKFWFVITTTNFGDYEIDEQLDVVDIVTVVAPTEEGKYEVFESLEEKYGDDELQSFSRLEELTGVATIEPYHVDMLVDAAVKRRVDEKLKKLNKSRVKRTFKNPYRRSKKQEVDTDE